MVTAKIVQECFALRRSPRLQGMEPHAHAFSTVLQHRRSPRKLTKRRRQKIREFFRNSQHHDAVGTRPKVDDLIEFMQESARSSITHDDVIEWMKDFELANVETIQYGSPGTFDANVRSTSGEEDEAGEDMVTDDSVTSPAAYISGAENEVGDDQDMDTDNNDVGFLALSERQVSSENSTDCDLANSPPVLQPEEGKNTGGLSPSIPSDLPRTSSSTSPQQTAAKQTVEVVSGSQGPNKLTFPLHIIIPLGPLPMSAIKDLRNQCDEILRADSVSESTNQDKNAQGGDSADDSRPATRGDLRKVVYEMRSSMVGFLLNSSN